jgi:putative transposase
VDGLEEKLRPGAPREAVLVAWAITWSGKKVMVHVAPGNKESTECCREFFEGMKRRGLSDPLLACTDGAPGMMRGVEECLPKSLRQRCLAHKIRNIGNKLCEQIQQEFKQAARAAYQAPSVEMARVLRQDVVNKYGEGVAVRGRVLRGRF